MKTKIFVYLMTISALCGSLALLGDENKPITVTQTPGVILVTILESHSMQSCGVTHSS